MTTCIL